MYSTIIFIKFYFQSFDLLFSDPNAPYDLSDTDASVSSIDLTWSHSGAVDKFKVYYVRGSAEEKSILTTNADKQYTLGSVGPAATMSDISVVALAGDETTESVRSNTLSAGTGKIYKY